MFGYDLRQSWRDSTSLRKKEMSYSSKTLSSPSIAIGKIKTYYSISFFFFCSILCGCGARSIICSQLGAKMACHHIDLRVFLTLDEEWSGPIIP